MQQIPQNSKEESRKKRWILIALMCTIMLAAMDVTIIATAIPQIVGDLGGFSLFSWVFSIYLLTQTVTIPIYGKFADLYGRKPIIIFGIIVFLVGSLLSAFSWDMLSLIVFRGVQGLGAGAIMATVNTLAGDLYSIEERGKIQGWLSSVWGMAAIIGPTLGGAFAEYLSWHWIFLINIPIGILSMSLIIIYLKENVVKKKHHIDYLGAFMMLLTGSVLIFTLMEGGKSFDWLSMNGILLILSSILLIGLTIFVELRSKEPIMPIWIWKNKIISKSNFAMILMGAIMLGPNMYLPIFGQSILGLGAIAAGLVLASSSIGWPIASTLSSKVYIKYGFRFPALLGITFIAIFSFSFPYLSQTNSVVLIVLDQVLLGAGFGFLSTPTLVGVQSIVKWEKRGVVTSSNMFSRYLGQSLGAALLGGLFNSNILNLFSEAPLRIRDKLPDVNQVLEALQGKVIDEEVQLYLLDAFHQSTNLVYTTMGFIAILAFCIVFFLPKKYPVLKGK